jgi:hypothetical protein
MQGVSDEMGGADVLQWQWWYTKELAFRTHEDKDKPGVDDFTK